MTPIETVLLSVAGWVAGLVSALVRDWLRRRHQIRKVARALMAVVYRLRDELGPEDGVVEVKMFGLESAVPEVHPWIDRQIAEAADIDANVVTHFLSLDRYLNNLRLFRSLLREMRRLGDETDKETKAALRALVESAVKGSNLYRIDGLNLYVKTRYCYEHVWFEDRILDVQSLARFSIGRLVFNR